MSQQSQSDSRSKASGHAFKVLKFLFVFLESESLSGRSDPNEKSQDISEFKQLGIRPIKPRSAPRGQTWHCAVQIRQRASLRAQLCRHPDRSCKQRLPPVEPRAAPHIKDESRSKP